MNQLIKNSGLSKWKKIHTCYFKQVSKTLKFDPCETFDMQFYVF